jgi:hypothetical protein
MRESSLIFHSACFAVAAHRAIEIDSIEQNRSRRLRARANWTIVPALASLVAIPLSALLDIG